MEKRFLNTQGKERLVQLAKSKDLLTIEAMAPGVGLHPRHFRDILQGYVPLSEKVSAALMAHFDLSREALFEITSDTPRPRERSKESWALTVKGGIKIGDQIVDFGEMRFGTGQVFHDDPNETPNSIELSKRLPVQKEYQQIQGLQFLIEKLPQNDVSVELEALPAALNASTHADRSTKAFVNADGSASRVLSQSIGQRIIAAARHAHRKKLCAYPGCRRDETNDAAWLGEPEQTLQAGGSIL